MAELATHYEEIRGRYPQDQLIILFDIDGTILDMRYMVLSLLQTYDRLHQTHFFADLTVQEITVHENNITPLLSAKQVSLPVQQKILAWYEQHAWSSQAMLEAHRPFAGVLETIRWFQMQPNTHVGLNTARGEALRTDTLRSLNKLGQEYKINFADELLYMRPDDWPRDVPAAKIEGVRYFQQQGYRVFAFIDNEPSNLDAITRIDPAGDLLLLHADTIFQSKEVKLPARVVGGKQYDLTNLISPDVLPQHIQFVWHGINDIANMGQFLNSDVHWGEFDVDPELMGLNLILRPDKVNRRPGQENKAWLASLDDALVRLWSREKGLKLNLKVNRQMVDNVLKRVDIYNFPETDLWFRGCIETLGMDGFRELAQRYPQAIIECEIDFLAPLIYGDPVRAKNLLDRFKVWGINRFAVSWQTPGLRQIFDQLEQWGFATNIYDTPDLKGFLEAVLLRPSSITSDFYFPQWSYYGRGSGKDGRYMEYAKEPVFEMAG